MATKAKKESAEVEIRRPSIEQLKALETFDDIRLLAQELGAEIVESKVLGDGFSLLEDKDYLVGKPCAFISWGSSEGDYGEFVSIRVMAQEKNGTVGKYVINDGSTGIAEQLRMLSQDNPNRMVVAPRGLRVSKYDKELYDPNDPNADENGMVTKRAKTYYVDTSSVA